MFFVPLLISIYVNLKVNLMYGTVLKMKALYLLSNVMLLKKKKVVIVSSLPMENQITTQMILLSLVVILKLLTK